MIDPRHCETARRDRTPARAIALVCVLASAVGVPAQDSPLASPPLVAKFVAALESSEPTLRGEAALCLAQTGEAVYYAPIRAIAHDRRDEARVRGIVALGVLAVAGVEVELGELLIESRHDAPEGHAAAFALGRLPDTHPTAAIDRYLTRISGGSVKRNRDTLAALLLGLGHRGHPARAATAIEILENESVKDAGLHVLAFRMLTRLEGAVPDDVMASLLDSRYRPVRQSVLVALRELPPGTSIPHTERIVTLARSDADPNTRASALLLLTHLRRTEALELIPRALRSHDESELAAGVRASLALEGGALRAVLERRLLEQTDDPLQAAMLEAWRGRCSPRLLDACFALAGDNRRSLRLRTAAARLVAQRGQKRIVPRLKHLIEALTDDSDLARCYRDLIALEAADDLRERVYPSRPSELNRFPARLEALYASGHPAADGLLERALDDDRLSSRYAAELLSVWRRVHMPEFNPAVLDLVPPRLAQILR